MVKTTFVSHNYTFQEGPCRSQKKKKDHRNRFWVLCLIFNSFSRTVLLISKLLCCLEISIVKAICSFFLFEDGYFLTVSLRCSIQTVLQLMKQYNYSEYFVNIFNLPMPYYMLLTEV